MCAHSAEPLNLPLFSQLCIGIPCLAIAVVFSLAKEEQAIGIKQEPLQGAWISRHQSKRNGWVLTLQ